MVFDFLYFSILIYDGRDAHASISEFARTLRHAGDNAMCASYNAFYKANFVVQRRSLVLLVASLIETNRDALIEVLYFTSFSIFQIFQERERDHFVSSIRAFSSHLLTVCSPSSVHLLWKFPIFGGIILQRTMRSCKADAKKLRTFASKVHVRNYD